MLSTRHIHSNIEIAVEFVMAMDCVCVEKSEVAFSSANWLVCNINLNVNSFFMPMRNSWWHCLRECDDVDDANYDDGLIWCSDKRASVLANATEGE